MAAAEIITLKPPMSMAELLKLPDGKHKVAQQKTKSGEAVGVVTGLIFHVRGNSRVWNYRYRRVPGRPNRVRVAFFPAPGNSYPAFSVGDRYTVELDPWSLSPQREPHEGGSSTA